MTTPRTKRTAAHRRAALAYQHRHQLAGLCAVCCEAVWHGGLCQRHAEARAVRARVRYQQTHGVVDGYAGPVRHWRLRGQ
ncbi:MAG TPA: hypothetical protein VES97_04140 [Solirubrobacteraceae bacterium]|nr:hypothetical protein [Solirubrobacteraceae bacterium]